MFKKIRITNRSAIMTLMLGVGLWAQIPEARAADYTLDDLSFMVGHWKGDEAMGGPEEGWLPPAKGVMVGVFRWPSVGGRYVIELLTITQEDDGIIFRFKHFDPDVTPWEKDRANTYKLAEVIDGCATFAGLDTPDHVPATIQYCRTDAETLVFRGAEKGQALSESDFVLTFTDIDVLGQRGAE